MSVDRRYWDSDAFLGWLLNEQDKAPKCEGVLKAAEAGQLQIVTSALTLTEVIRLKGKPRLARVHRLPQLADERDELTRIPLEALQQLDETALCQQSDVLSKHREETAREKPGHELRVMPRLLERAGDLGKLRGDLSRDLRGAPRRVEPDRVEPHLPEALADALVAQILQAETMRARIGERSVGRSRAGELGVELDRVANVRDHEKRRPALVGRQRPRVLLGLTARAQHGIVKRLAFRLAQLLRFKDECAAAVTVHETVRLGAVAVSERDAALEDVGVVTRIVARRIGGRHFEQPAQFPHEQLVVGSFGAARGLPTRDEGINAAHGAEVALVGTGGVTPRHVSSNRDCGQTL